jgi:peptide/nickel transport system permease protein
VRNYILKRLFFMVITLIVITLVSYTMMRLAPGDPTRAQMMAGESQGTMREDQKETLAARLFREKYHLDKNPLVGYGYWIKGVVTRFDWGTSIVLDPGAPVVDVIAERLPVTLRLEVLSILLVYAFAVPIGIYSAVKQHHWTERGLTVILFLLYSLPTFWVGLLLIMFFSGDLFLNIFPVAGLSPGGSYSWGKSTWQVFAATSRYYVLPVACLTYGSLAGMSRYARVGLLEIVRQDYIRTARAKGVPEWKVILKHAFRNGLIPLVTLFAGLLPGLIAGSIIVEYIFTIRGMGNLAISALTTRDYPLMMALFTIGAALTLLGILLSDLLYGVVDPRISYE